MAAGADGPRGAVHRRVALNRGNWHGTRIESGSIIELHGLQSRYATAASLQKAPLFLAKIAPPAGWFLQLLCSDIDEEF